MKGLSPDTIRSLVREALEAVLRERGLSLSPGEGSAAPSSTATPVSPAGVVRPVGAGAPSAGGPGLSRGVSQGAGADRRVVAFLTGGGGDLGLLRLSLQTLSQQFVLDLTQTTDFIERRGPWDPGLPAERARIHLAPDRGTALGLLDGAGAVVVPLLTRSLAAKASLAIDDDVPAAFLGAALERGVPVVAVRSDADPDTLSAIPALQQGPNSLRRLLETYIQRLTGWGVRWTTIELLPGAVAGAVGGGAKGTRGTLGTHETEGTQGAEGTKGIGSRAGQSGAGGWAGAAATSSPGGVAGSTSPASSAGSSLPTGLVDPGRRRFITKEDLWGLLERGQMELRIGPHDLITPEAEDFAGSRGIRIVRQGS